MNYAYLFVDNLNGHSYENGLNELKTSIATLKKFQQHNSIQVFNNETFGKNIDYFKKENIIHNHIDLSRSYGKSDSKNPISILVEKIISLKNYNENEDIVLLDIDTSFNTSIPEDFWDDNHIVLDNAEYYIMQWRNLDKVLPQISWKQFDINFDSSFIMYNTGVIHIPKRFRKELCEKALSIVDYLNENFDPEERCGNKLDEQIALSIVCHDTFGKYDHIKLSNNYIHHHWEDRQKGINWWEDEKFNYAHTQVQEIKPTTKLPISVGILSWRSDQTLRNTLDSYRKNGFFDIVDDVTLFFQEAVENDITIAREYNLPFIALSQNIGIGNAFSLLASNCKNENILLLEHDWELIEDKKTTFMQLSSGIQMLDFGYHAVKYRHRKNPGFPLFTLTHKGEELTHYDPIIDLQGAHLFDSVHWIDNPDVQFSDKISKHNDHYITTSRWSNFTNNPCLYKKDFYISATDPFKNKGSVYDGLESNISHWWARQNFNIACGEGLFMHNDIQKYNNTEYSTPIIQDENEQKQFIQISSDYPDEFFDEVFQNYHKILDYFTPYTYLDIGVCKGHAIPFIMKKLPSLKRIEMIEACKDHENDLRILSEKTKIPYYIEVMSDSIKQVVFYSMTEEQKLKYDTQPGNSYYKENTPHYLNCVKEIRKTNTLDNMYAKNHQFDLIKLDTQGSELDILKGGKQLLKTTKGLIIEEISKSEYNYGAPKNLDIKNYLEENGFVLVDYFHKYHNTIQDSNYDWVEYEQHDAFYVRIDILENLNRIK